MKIVSLLSFLLLGNVLLAQQFHVSFSEQMKLDGDAPLKLGDDYYGLDADTKSQFGYTFKLNKIKYSAKLLKYDRNLKVSKEVKLSDGERVYGPFAPTLREIGDKLYFLYYQLADESEHIKLWLSEVDLSSLSLKTPLELLDIEQKNLGLMQSAEVLTGKNLQFSVSPDKSKLLVLWHAGDGNNIYFSVFGEDFKKLRGGNETIKKESKIVLTNACIDNAANVYACYSNSKQNNSYVLVNRPNANTTELDLNILQGTPVEAFVVATSNASAVKIIGTYKENTGNLAGVFTQTLSTSDLKFGNVVRTAFPQWMVDQFDNDGWGSSKAKSYGLAPYIKMQPFALEDGSVELVGEFRKVVNTEKWSYMLAGGIADVHFKNDGVVFARIPKARVSAGSDIGDSFYPVVYKSQMVLFYNDHESNIKQDITKSALRSDNYKNSVLVAATVSADGAVKREILIDLSNDNYLPVAEDLQKLTSSSVLIPIRKIKGMGKVADDFKWGLVEMK